MCIYRDEPYRLERPRSRQLADQLKLLSEAGRWPPARKALCSMQDRKIFKSSATRKWPVPQRCREASPLLRQVSLRSSVLRPSGGVGSRGLSRESFVSLGAEVSMLACACMVLIFEKLSEPRKHPPSRNDGGGALSQVGCAFDVRMA